MEKTIIVPKKETREIEVHLKTTSLFTNKDLLETVSLACMYKADFNYSSKKKLFVATCNSEADLESLLHDYEEYFYTK